MTKIINFSKGLGNLSYSTLIANYNTNNSYKEELDKRIAPFIKKTSQRDLIKKKTKRENKRIAKR